MPIPTDHTLVKETEWKKGQGRKRQSTWTGWQFIKQSNQKRNEPESKRWRKPLDFKSRDPGDTTLPKL